jgi:hypothetical protein
MTLRPSFPSENDWADFVYYMAILPKWLIIWTLALPITLLLYELLIRRVNPIRWLFGMKPRQRTPQEDRNNREQEGHKAESVINM